MWPRSLSIMVGILLMASPSLVEMGRAAKASNVICGALSSSAATIAIWETTRGLRWFNLVIGSWLLISAFVFTFDRAGVAGVIFAGVLLIAMSLIRGSIKELTGGGWAVLFKGDAKE